VDRDLVRDEVNGDIEFEYDGGNVITVTLPSS
jgi:hypothetical protein